MKLYFIKLGKGLVLTAFVWLALDMLLDVLITAVNVIIPKSLPIIRTICYLALPVFFIALYTYLRRQNNGEMRRSYLDALDDSPFVLGKELTIVLKSRDFLTELAAFGTILIPLSLSRNILSTLLTVVIYTLFFLLIDAGIWLLIHRKWAKERLRKPEKAGK